MAERQYKLVKCNINGKDVATMVDVRASLTDMLRNNYHLTSVKKGCEVGECGACSVLIDGEAFNSCIYMAIWAEGKKIITLEGLSQDGELDALQESFMVSGAVQCGFCTPGMILSAKALLAKNPRPSREEIRRALSGNLCRCTGYSKIIKAVEMAIAK